MASEREITGKDERRNPDIFTPEEAAAYLTAPSVESLRGLEDNYGLIPIKAFKEKRYHREDLDACLQRMRGIDPAAGRRIQKPLRMAGGQG